MLGKRAAMECKDLAAHFLGFVEKFERSSRAKGLFKLCLPMGYLVNESQIQFFNFYEAPLGYPVPCQRLISGQKVYL